MDVMLRRGRIEDADVCGTIAFEAFKAISSEHNFPWDFPSPQPARGLMRMLLSHPGCYVVVAESEGRVLGSNSLDERGTIGGIGPITVDPQWQDRGVGRRLMLALIDRAAERRLAGIRLLQSAYHNRSLCLYTRLGFDSREPVSKIDGKPLGLTFPGYRVRPAVAGDLAVCNALCRRVHGHDRAGEVEDAIRNGTARVVEHLGALTAYATEIGFLGHAVAENNQGLKALIGAADSIEAGGLLLPTRNNELFRWCLGQGLRLVHQMTLMTVGLYNEPQGGWLPSVLY